MSETNLDFIFGHGGVLFILLGFLSLRIVVFTSIYFINYLDFKNISNSDEINKVSSTEQILYG